MKTTIDLADDLAVKLKMRTVQKGISLRSAVQEALRLWLASDSSTAPKNLISREVGLMSGQGLSPEACIRSWEDLRAMSYEHHGHLEIPHL